MGFKEGEFKEGDQVIIKAYGSAKDAATIVGKIGVVESVDPNYRYHRVYIDERSWPCLPEELELYSVDVFERMEYFYQYLMECGNGI